MKSITGIRIKCVEIPDDDDDDYFDEYMDFAFQTFYSIESHYSGTYNDIPGVFFVTASGRTYFAKGSEKKLAETILMAHESDQRYINGIMFKNMN